MHALLLLLSLAVPASAQVKAVPPLVVPVARGPVVRALNAQLDALASARTAPQLKAAYAASVAPTPLGEAATPAAFAARAALVQALAAPQTEIPALAASLRAAGGHKAERAAESLEAVGRTLAEASAKDRGSVTRAAAALHARFDGTSAAPGEAVDLAALGTVEPGPRRKKALKKLAKENARIRELQERLVAENERSYLEMIQAIDTAGKDGVVKHGHRVNPAWAEVHAFKKPTPAELKEDYKARINRRLPAKRHTGIHIRTIYEDVIMPLLLETMPRKDALARVADILAWELGLMRSGTTLRKVFLSVSKDVQRERLQDRLDDPEKHWKFDPNDLKTRELWDRIQAIYGMVLARSSTVYAPWTVIGADDKAARNLAYARGTRKALERMDPRYPEKPELYELKIPK